MCVVSLFGWACLRALGALSGFRNGDVCLPSMRSVLESFVLFASSIRSSSLGCLTSIRKKGFIPWRNSEPQAAILLDLKDGIISLDEDVQPAVELWENMYKLDDVFHNVCFEQFKLRLADHRKQVKKENKEIEEATKAFQDYRMRHPERKTDNHGRKILGSDPETKQLLLNDVRNNKHKELTPSNLRETRREYKQYTLDEFRPKIYQVVRLVRWHNYLKLKRESTKQKKEVRSAKME